MLEHACTYLNKQSSEYTKIMNVSLYKLLRSYPDRDISAHCQTMERFAKTVQVHSQTFFRTAEVSWNQGTSIITFRQKTQEKKAREIFFLLDTLKTTFGMENLIQRWRQSEHFFRFLKKERGGLPLSSVACVMTGALTKKSNQGSGKYNGFS